LPQFVAGKSPRFLIALFFHCACFHLCHFQSLQVFNLQTVYAFSDALSRTRFQPPRSRYCISCLPIYSV
jgi:hypothetical protein